MKQEFRLTGRHVLLMLLGFFAMIIAANATFLTFAIRSFPGEKEEKSYLQGLHYNEVIASRSEKADLGWRAAIEKADREGEMLHLVVRLTRKDDAPLNNLLLDGTLMRPASDSGAQAFQFVPQGDGRYSASVPAQAGAWDLSVTTSGGDSDAFQFENRLVVR